MTGKMKYIHFRVIGSFAICGADGVHTTKKERCVTCIHCISKIKKMKKVRKELGI